MKSPCAECETVETLYDTAVASHTLSEVSTVLKSLLSTATGSVSDSLNITTDANFFWLGGLWFWAEGPAVYQEDGTATQVGTGTVTDVLTAHELIADTAQVVSTVAEVATAIESLASTSSVSDSLTDVLVAVENLQATVQSGVGSAEVVCTLIDDVVVTAQATISVLDTKLSENSEELLETAVGTGSVTDVGTFVDTISDLAAASASLEEVRGFIESVISTSVATGRVDDYVFGQVVAGWITKYTVSIPAYYRPTSTMYGYYAPTVSLLGYYRPTSSFNA